MRSGKVIRADEARVFREALEILEQARTQAGRILQDAQAAAQEERQRGFQQGLADASDARNLLLAEAVSLRDKFLRDSELLLGGLVMTAVRTVIGNFDDATLAQNAVISAMQLLRHKLSAVTVRVHPVHRERMGIWLDTLRSKFPRIANVELEFHADIGERACCVAGELGLVQFDIDSQLERLEHTLARAGSYLAPGKASLSE